MPLASSPIWPRQVAAIRELCRAWMDRTKDIEPIRREIQIIDQGTYQGGGKKRKRRKR